MINQQFADRKDRERNFKKNEIAEAATKLFAIKGYESTTLDEIASLAQFGKGTIYNYFNSKEHIYEYILEEIFLSHLDMLKIAIKETTSIGELIKRITDDILNFSLNNPEKFYLIVEIRTNKFRLGNKYFCENCIKYDNIILEIYKKRILEAIEKKELKNINPETIVLFYPAFVFPYIVSLLNIKKPEEIDIKKESAYLFEIIMHGIALT